MTELEVTEVKSIFRRDIEDDPNNGFDRLRQLRISAERLQHLRENWPEDWQRVFETLELNPLAGPEHRGVREFKLRIAREIRGADESVDHRTTVSFVSGRVARRLLDERRRRVILGQLKSKAFGHEHSVPVDVILRIVVDPRNNGADLFEVLRALCQRALLHREEISQLDRQFGSEIPPDVATRPFASIGMRTLPFRMFGLARYHAAVPGLVDNLIPLNGRSERLLDEFRGLIARGFPEQQEPNLCYLPARVVP